MSAENAASSDEAICPICYVTQGQIRVPHRPRRGAQCPLLCRECFLQWHIIEERQTCTYCREIIPARELYRIHNELSAQDPLDRGPYRRPYQSDPRCVSPAHTFTSNGLLDRVRVLLFQHQQGADTRLAPVCFECLRFGLDTAARDGRLPEWILPRTLPRGTVVEGLLLGFVCLWKWVKLYEHLSRQSVDATESLDVVARASEDIDYLMSTCLELELFTSRTYLDVFRTQDHGLRLQIIRDTRRARQAYDLLRDAMRFPPQDLPPSLRVERPVYVGTLTVAAVGGAAREPGDPAASAERVDDRNADPRLDADIEYLHQNQHRLDDAIESMDMTWANDRQRRLLNYVANAARADHVARQRLRLSVSLHDMERDSVEFAGIALQPSRPSRRPSLELVRESTPTPPPPSSVSPSPPSSVNAPPSSSVNPPLPARPLAQQPRRRYQVVRRASHTTQGPPRFIVPDGSAALGYPPRNYIGPRAYVRVRRRIQRPPSSADRQ